MWNLKSGILLVTLAFLAQLCPSCGGGDPASTAVGGAVGSIVVKDLIDDARKTASQTIVQAEGSARNAIDHASNNLHILSIELERQVGKNVDKVVGSLDENTRNLARLVHNSMEELRETRKEVIGLEDDVALDLEQALAGVPFYRDRLFIKRISGVSIIDGEVITSEAPSHRLELTGPGIGNPSAERRVLVKSIFLGDEDLTDKILTHSTELNRRMIDIPSKALAKRFDFRSVTAHLMKVTFQEQEYKGLFSKKWKDAREVTQEFYLYLFPRFAGSFEVTAFVEEFGWVGAGRWEYTEQGPSNHCGGDCDDNDNWPLGPDHTHSFRRDLPKFRPSAPYAEGDLRLSGGASISFVSGTGGHDHSHRASVTNNGKTLTASYTPRTHANRYRMSASQERYARTNVIEHSEEVSLVFGEVVNVKLPGAAKSAKISGRSALGTAVAGELFTLGAIDGYIEIISVEDVGEDKVVSLRALLPTRG